MPPPPIHEQPQFYLTIFISPCKFIDQESLSFMRFLGWLDIIRITRWGDRFLRKNRLYLRCKVVECEVFLRKCVSKTYTGTELTSVSIDYQKVHVQDMN